jgi:hypothetical protein
MSPFTRRAQEPGVCDVDDLVETVRKGLLALDTGWTFRFAQHSFGDTFTVTPKGYPSPKEGLQ